MSDTSRPVDTRHMRLKDARSRAGRTLRQLGVLSAAGVALGWLSTVLTGVQWTKEWWVATGTAFAMTFIGSLVSYWHRRLGTPPS